MTSDRALLASFCAAAIVAPSCLAQRGAQRG
jgi:hypothetical protein